jgi:hypothetical protein
MQYVYILTNVFVPELVKFGFSTRDPSDRATELSAPTGVPGKWIVYHYWEVEDGYAVEQAIFKQLKKYRVERQEFLRMAPDDAVKAISEKLREVGTNPIEKARQEKQAQARLQQAQAEQYERERQEALARKSVIEERKFKIINEIEKAQAPVREAIDKSDDTAMKIFFAAIFSVAFLVNMDKGFTEAFLIGAAFVLISIIPFGTVSAIIVGTVKNNSKYNAELQDIENRILASHGLTSMEDLEVPAELKRYG